MPRGAVAMPLAHTPRLLTPVVLVLQETAEAAGAVVGEVRRRTRALSFAVTLMRIQGLDVGGALQFYGLALAWVLYSAAAVVFCLVLYPALGVFLTAISGVKAQGGLS